MQSYKKYTPYPTVAICSREWINRSINVAPTWVSTDLRDGNQALAMPMSIDQKVAYFKALVRLGFKEIEIAYPSASQTEFAFCRTLIEEGLIPDDVRVGVLVPSIERHIRLSFEALQGAKRIVMHLYNPTAANQREVVFGRSKEAIIALAVEGTQIVKEEADRFKGAVTFEYSPESFSQTELAYAIQVANAVIQIWQPTPRAPMILNLPNTLEASMPHIYADRIEWMRKHIVHPESVIISVHPHNDRGTAVASAEMAVLAGATRVEGTILGQGERAGNVDLVTLAFNCYAQGVDPRLDLSQIDAVLADITTITGGSVPARHPYVGSMIYTAFSGTHQDAIKKGIEHYQTHQTSIWNVPYLAIDPQDIGRTYKDVIRINSQSGKSGVAYILKEIYGIEISRTMQIEVAKEVQKIAEKRGGEISSDEVLGIYKGIVSNREDHNAWNPDSYNQHADFVSRLGLPVVELLAPKAGERILDLGCGEGSLALEIARSGAQVIGVDLSEEMVRSAQTKGIEAYVMSATSLKFDKFFDAIFSNATLHWVIESQIAVQNIYKVLHPKGRFIAEFGGFGNVDTIVNAIAEVFAKHPEYGAFENPWFFPDDKAYRALLEAEGFEIAYIELIDRPTLIDDVANWLKLFANGIVSHLSSTQQEVFYQEVRTLVAPKLFDEQNGWHADYVRIRVKAYKKGDRL